MRLSSLFSEFCEHTHTHSGKADNFSSWKFGQNVVEDREKDREKAFQG